MQYYCFFFFNIHIIMVAVAIVAFYYVSLWYANRYFSGKFNWLKFLSRKLDWIIKFLKILSRKQIGKNTSYIYKYCFPAPIYLQVFELRIYYCLQYSYIHILNWWHLWLCIVIHNFFFSLSIRMFRKSYIYNFNVKNNRINFNSVSNITIT